MISEPLVLSLQKLGILAEIKGRNDIVINNHKISGIAQLIQNNKLCSHCSLLFDTDLSFLEKVLNPDIEKIRFKGIKSVKDRVVNIQDYLYDYKSMEQFKNEFSRLYLEHFGFVDTYFFPSVNFEKLML